LPGWSEILAWFGNVADKAGFGPGDAWQRFPRSPRLRRLRWYRSNRAAPP